MPKTPHIAAIVPYTVYPAKMGGQKGIAMFYQYLSKLLPVTMISTDKQVPEQFDGEFVSLLGTSKYRYINAALFLKIRQKINKCNATHIVLEHPYFGWLGILLQKSSNLKLVVHSHNIEALRFKSMQKWWWKILWQYEKSTHRQADINFFITEEDRKYAIDEFRLSPAKCHTITYGIDLEAPPSSFDKQIARKKLEEVYGIQPSENILFFNGTLSYPPNLQAVDNILKYINPLLLQTTGYTYKIIICGKGLPERYNELRDYASSHIIYAGFVDDITLYFKGADVFLNPIVDGGGIKTKLVEALAYNNSAVSNQSGAIGIPITITGNKLAVVKDNDWEAFVAAVFAVKKEELIPEAFFKHFYWGHIAAKAASILSS